MNEMNEREQDAAALSRTAQRHADLRALATLRCVNIEETALLIRVANAGADLIQSQHREIDRLTAERDAARKDLADLRARLTEIADENIEIDLDYVSVGDDAADAWSTAWGAAGRELREALGLESETSESLRNAVEDVNAGRTRPASEILKELRESEASE